MRTCEICNKDISNKRSDAKVCGPNCRAAKAANNNKRRIIRKRKTTDKCPQKECFKICDSKTEIGSFSCANKRKNIRNVELNVEKTTKDPKNTSTNIPGTNSTNNQDHRAHRFLYYCNYKGTLEGTLINDKGWYKLNHKDYTKMLKIINSKLQLYIKSRQNQEAISRANRKGPSVSIQFTKKNKCIRLGIEHFYWEAIDIPDVGLTLTPIENMEQDAQYFTLLLVKHIEGLESIDNLHMEKMRMSEGHIGRPDKDVKRLQEEGTANYEGKTTFNPGHWTESNKGKIQHEREIDSKRHENIIKNLGPDIYFKTPEGAARGAFEDLNLSRSLGMMAMGLKSVEAGQEDINRALAASIKIQMKTEEIQMKAQEGVKTYAVALEQHTGFVEEAREAVRESKEFNKTAINILMELKDKTPTKKIIPTEELVSIQKKPLKKKQPKKKERKWDLKGSIWNF